MTVIFGHSQILIDNGPLTGDNKYEIGDSKWNSSVLYYYINKSSNHLTYNEREQAIQNAFEQWEQYTTLSFVQVSNPTIANMTDNASQIVTTSNWQSGIYAALVRKNGQIVATQKMTIK